MKILIINNNTIYLGKLKKILGDNKVKIISYNKINLKKITNFDKIILSGGHDVPVKIYPRAYKKEILLIKKSKIPILGICLGYELIAYAFGERLIFLKSREKGIKLIKKISNDKLLNKLRKFRLYENHHWAIKRVKNLVSLAKSKSEIEIFRHPIRDIYGIQAHPENFVNKTEGRRLIKNFLSI